MLCLLDNPCLTFCIGQRRTFDIEKYAPLQSHRCHHLMFFLALSWAQPHLPHDPGLVPYPGKQFDVPLDMVGRAMLVNIKVHMDPSHRRSISHLNQAGSTPRGQYFHKVPSLDSIKKRCCRACATFKPTSNGRIKMFVMRMCLRRAAMGPRGTTSVSGFAS